MRANLDHNIAHRIRHSSTTFGSLQSLMNGAFVIHQDGPSFYFLDPGSSSQDVFLPPFVPGGGQFYIIGNIGTGGNLVLRSDGGILVHTVNAGSLNVCISTPNSEWFIAPFSSSGPGGAGVTSIGSTTAQSLAGFVDSGGLVIQAVGVGPGLDMSLGTTLNLDPDLVSLAAAAASGAGPAPSGLYYRKAPNIWAPLNLVNLTLNALTDTLTGGAGGGGGIATINGHDGPAITIVAGTNITIDNSVPDQISIASTGAGGGGNVNSVPTPLAGQLARWTGATTIEGLNAAQGSILYRDATQWVVLAPGTSGQHLQTNGAAANPIWSTGGNVSSVPTPTAGQVAVWTGANTIQGVTGTPVTNGDKGDITVSGAGNTTWTIDDGVVSNAKLVNVVAPVFKGRTTAGAGAVEDLNPGQATAMLDIFTRTLKGLTPPSGGTVGTTNFLREDGTWNIPAGGAAITSGNRIVNPDGIVWQTQNLSAAEATDAAFVFDGWYALTQTSGVTASQVSHPEVGTSNMMRLTQPAGTAQRMGLCQIVEAVDCNDMRGRVMTLSARVRMALSAGTVRYAILGWTGAADSLPREIVLSWTSASYIINSFFINSPTLTVVGSGSTAVGLDAFANIAPLTVTIPNNITNLYIFFWTEGAATVGASMDIGKIQLEVGSTVTPYIRPPFDEVLTRCQRLFEKSYDLNVKPGTAAQNGGVNSLYLGPAGAAANLIPSNQFFNTVGFRVQKRSGASVTIYGYSGGVGAFSNSAGTDFGTGAVAFFNGQNSFVPFNAGVTHNIGSNSCWFHWTADSRLGTV